LLIADITRTRTIVIVTAGIGRDTDRYSLPQAALGRRPLAAERAFTAGADHAALRTAGQLGIEHLDRTHRALGIEARPLAADAITARSAAGQRLRTADLLLDEGTLPEDPRQADGAIRTALAVTALQRLVTAIQSADNVAVAQGAVAADR
jgi:hypothetical protein